MSLAMPNAGSQVSSNNQVAMVNNIATLILAKRTSGDRSEVTLINMDASATIYIGSDNTVSASNGFPLAPGSPAGGSITRPTSKDIWGFAAGTPKVAYITDDSN